MTAQTVTQAVEKRDDGPINLMWSRKSHFNAVLPASVDVTAFLGTAAGALYANATLMEAAKTTPDSLIVALMECAALGHMPGTDEYYLTPRRDKGRWRVLGIEGYRGVIERMYRSGAVQKVVVREVCARDLFSFVEGEMDIPVHDTGNKHGAATGGDFFGQSGQRDRGEMVGAIAYAKLLGSVWSRVVLLDRGDVHAARAAGGWKPDDQYSPWNRLDGGADRPELTGRSMWWKTAAHRLEPWVPTSREYRADMLRASAAAAELAVRPRAAAVPELPAPPAVNGHAFGEPAEAEIVVTAQEVNDHFKAIGYTVKEKDEVLHAAGVLAGRKLPLASIGDLTPDQLATVAAALEGCTEKGDVVALMALSSGPGQDGGEA